MKLFKCHVILKTGKRLKFEQLATDRIDCIHILKQNDKIFSVVSIIEKKE